MTPTGKRLLTLPNRSQDFKNVMKKMWKPRWQAMQKNCGFQMLNDDEILTSVQEESDLVNDEPNEDEDNNNNESSRVHQMLMRFMY
ncbi:hypothetical protein TNCV_31241 [Trichonephila clavipes]|nr:hypothetical protein TNCV_31241 [Trichonephila clavipes]